MLSNAYFLAKFRFDTAENEPAKKIAKFSKNAFSKNAFFENLIEPLERDRPVTAPTSSVTTGEKTDPNQGSRALFVIPG